MKIRDAFLAFGAPDFTEAEIDAVARVMRSGWVGMGEETIAFETELSAYVGVPEVVSVSSCTAALFLGLLAEGVSAGDEVIVPSLTWCATANAALYLGAIPVFCDIDPQTMCATPESVVAQLTEKTKAVVVVHYGGYGMDVKALRAALPSRVAIIEDAAHALGARYPDGGRVGSSGNSVCFSFYANKNLSTADGGAIALADSVKAERIRRLRMNGMASNAWSRYINPSTALLGGIQELGYKMNFTDLQAAIGRVQLKRFDEMSVRRSQLGRHYRQCFASVAPDIAFQKAAFSEDHARHLLVGIFDPALTGMERDDLLLALRARNIGASIHYQPLHTMPFYEGFCRTRLPVTESLAQRIMTLPISARMDLTDVNYVMDHFAELLEQRHCP